MSAPLTRQTFYTKTPEQLRSFRLLTLAQMLHLEAQGLSMTGRSARRQAIEALDLNHASGAATVETGELIEGLRDQAAKVLGICTADPKQGPRGATL